MPRGYLCLVLHAHLPYVRHPEFERFFEESWLFEAITESYVPLVRLLERLTADGIAPRLTVSLSPTLLAMLRDPLLQERYLRHLDRMEALGARERERTRAEPAFHALAGMYRDHLAEVRELYEGRYGRDLAAAFDRFRRQGVLELITTAATHGYLPLLRTEPQAVRAQLLTAAHSFERTFGGPADGLWLPECGYFPGLEDLAAEAGFRYFFVETHGILNASPRPRHGISAPIACPNGMVAFGRDPDASRRVWSRDEGYPGDPNYRDFYRDIGFDLAAEAVAPFTVGGFERVATGYKYYRITGPGPHKEPYEPARAAERIAVHADDFVASRLANLDALEPRGDPPPVFVAPFDAELFGHWWYEGPDWLEATLRRFAAQPDAIALTTPSEYLARGPRLQCTTPSPSSWGEKGYNEFWLNPVNDWIYPHLNQAARAMRELAAGDGPGGSVGTDPLKGRALRQAARSLLLAQGSDWAFIMKSGTSVDYAHSRIRDHLARFHYLRRGIESHDIDERRLRALETIDNVFPDVDPRVFV